MMSVFNVTDITDNACINIYPIGGDFVAASDSDVVLSFDPETLETKDRVSGRFSVNGDCMTTALNCRVRTLLQDCQWSYWIGCGIWHWCNLTYDIKMKVFYSQICWLIFVLQCQRCKNLTNACQQQNCDQCTWVSTTVKAPIDSCRGQTCKTSICRKPKCTWRVLNCKAV